MSIFWPEEIRPYEPMSREDFRAFCEDMHRQMVEEPIALEPAMYLTRKRIQELFEVTPWSDLLATLQARQRLLEGVEAWDRQKLEEGLF